MLPIRLNLAASVLEDLLSVWCGAVGYELSVSRGMSQGLSPHYGLLMSDAAPDP